MSIFNVSQVFSAGKETLGLKIRVNIFSSETVCLKEVTRDEMDDSDS